MRTGLGGYHALFLVPPTPAATSLWAFVVPVVVVAVVLVTVVFAMSVATPIAGIVVGLVVPPLIVVPLVVVALISRISIITLGISVRGFHSSCRSIFAHPVIVFSTFRIRGVVVLSVASVAPRIV